MERVEYFARIYLDYWRFDKVILYSVGLDALAGEWRTTTNPRITRWIDQGKLVIVDLRDEFQFFYGMQSSYALLTSHSVAQNLLKIDCLARSKSLNARWTLHVDVDEILVPGPNMLNQGWKSKSWSEISKAKPFPENAEFVSFAAVFPSIAQMDLEEFEVCTKQSDTSNWSDAEIERNLLAFSRVLVPDDSSSEAFRCEGQPNAMCRGPRGARKVAVRVNLREPFLISGVGTHDIRRLAYYSRPDVVHHISSTTGKVESLDNGFVPCDDPFHESVLSGFDYFLVHLRCLNFS